MNVKVYKAIADPTRRRIMQLLRERDMTAGELAEKFDFERFDSMCHWAYARGNMLSPLRG